MLVTNDNSWPNLSHKFRTFWNFTRCVSFFGHWYSVLARDKTTVSDWKLFNKVNTYSCWIYYWYFNICYKKTCKFVLMRTANLIVLFLKIIRKNCVGWKIWKWISFRLWIDADLDSQIGWRLVSFLSSHKHTHLLQM